MERVGGGQGGEMGGGAPESSGVWEQQERGTQKPNWSNLAGDEGVGVEAWAGGPGRRARGERWGGGGLP